MQLTNKNTIVAGHTYVIPAGFLSATDYSGPQVQPEMVLKSSDPALKPAVSIENNLGTLKASMTPALALVTEGARLPASLSLENSSFQSPGQFMGPITEGYLSPHPDIPLTLTSLLLASLAWSQRAALQKRVKIHSSLPGNTKVGQAQGSGGPKPIAETQLTRNLAQKISSLSLDYL